MNDLMPPGGPVRPSRVERGAKARRARGGLVYGIVAGLAVAAVGTYLVIRSGDDVLAPATGRSQGPDAAARPILLALQVDGGPEPTLAVIGVPADGTPFFMPLPPDLSMVVPGQGETSTPGVAALPGDSMRVALSNLAGVWVDHFVVLSSRDLARAIDAGGGLDVELPASYETVDEVLGPGKLTLSGAQAKAFLAGASDDFGARWEIVVRAMLADPPRLVSDGSVETDDAEAVNELMAAAAGAEAVAMPTTRVTGTIVVPEYQALDGLLSESLGSVAPVPTIVQNGSGEPGLGEAVASRIIPAGFRVVLSQNAQSSDVDRTNVFANGADHEEEARVIKDALGVGRVRVTALPSNVGDITIVVGKDFTA